MEISVQARHHETVRPEIGRLHASARAEASDQHEVLRKATEAVNTLQAEFARVQAAGGVTDIVVRPIATGSSVLFSIVIMSLCLSLGGLWFRKADLIEKRDKI